MTSEDAWVDDLAPIKPADWNRARARHLLNRAGFGGTPEDIDRLAAMTPAAAVERLVDYEDERTGALPAFEHSGVYDATLQVFPPSRPAATRKAETTGEAIGVRVKPEGTRRVQPVVDRFFFWLRATALETRRVAAWWADRMVATDHPLQEKMALFWHGHFATGADKVRDYRKMLVQLELFHQKGTGNFRELLVSVAKDPAMLVFLDAGQNVKGAPNENFGREVMELFTMGVGNYSETDIREAARAFTGWTNDDLRFKRRRGKARRRREGIPRQTRQLRRRGHSQHHPRIRRSPRTSSPGRSTATSYATISPRTCRSALGAILRENDYELKPLLRTIFLSRDFYSEPSVGTRIKGPVDLIVSMCRELGREAGAGRPGFQ